MSPRIIYQGGPVMGVPGTSSVPIGGPEFYGESQPRTQTPTMAPPEPPPPPRPPSPAPQPQGIPAPSTQQPQYSPLDMLWQAVTTPGMIEQYTPPTTVQTTETTQAARSPELEAQYQDIVRQLNELSTGYEQAYGGVQASYDDVIRSLMNVYEAQAGQERGAVSTAALTSGLTPLEATQAGLQARAGVAQEYYPQQAALRAEQAGVPVQLQEALAGVTGQYANVLNMMSPYYQAIAGTTVTGEQITTDPAAYLQATTDLVGMMDSSAQGWAQLDLQAQGLNLQERQILIDQQIAQDQQELTAWLEQSQQAGMNQRQAEAIAADASAQSAQQAWSSAERLGAQANAATQAANEMAFSAQQTSQQQDWASEEARLEREAAAAAQMAAQTGGPQPGDWGSIVAPTTPTTPTPTQAPAPTPTAAPTPTPAPPPGVLAGGGGLLTGGGGAGGGW